MTFNQVLDRLEKEVFIEAIPDTAAFYILPDGRFLYTVDFYGEMSTNDHANLYYFLVDDLGFDKEEAVDYFKRNGCITCNLDYRIAYIVLPEKITYSQREALYKCVDLLIREKDITKQVEVTTFPYKNRLLITDFVELYDIFKKYYLSGRLPSRFGEDLKLHKTLNPVLWTDDNKLRSSVNNKIRKIVKLFKDELKEWGIDLIIKDIVIVGSNASYNYTSNSDIDVHIVADIDKLNCNQRHLQIIYDLFKTNFNNKYDIDFHNISVELYVEDYNKPAKSNGRYSIISNKWLSLPSVDKIPDVDERRVDKLFKKWEDRYFDLLDKLGESKKEEDIKLDKVPQITDIESSFSKSKIIDSKGHLLKCYHSSNNDFDKFEIRNSVNGRLYGSGIYFSTHSDYMFSYGKIGYECYLNIINPWYFGASYDEIKNFIEKDTNKPVNETKLKEYFAKGYGSDATILDYYENVIKEYGITFKDLLIRNNYDGIIVCDYREELEDRYTEIVAFDPSQIYIIKKYYLEKKNLSLEEDIEKHDTLNTLLFDENDELKPEIKEAIKKFYVCGILLENIVDNSRLQPVPNDYKIIELQPFKNKIKNVKNKLEDNEIEIYIKANPPEASYGGGLYKIRFTPKSSNRSKRGHLRILYGRVDSLKICILMSVLEKQEKENFTDSEINSFKIMLTSFRR